MVIIWINRFGAHCPLLFLKDNYLIKNLLYLKSKGMKYAEDVGSTDWLLYVPNIYYDVYNELLARGLLEESDEGILN